MGKNLLRQITTLNSSMIDADGLEKDIRSSSLNKMKTDFSMKDPSINLKTNKPLYEGENLITMDAQTDEDGEHVPIIKVEDEEGESVDISEADKKWAPQEYKKMGSVQVKV